MLHHLGWVCEKWFSRNRVFHVLGSSVFYWLMLICSCFFSIPAVWNISLCQYTLMTGIFTCLCSEFPSVVSGTIRITQRERLLLMLGFFFFLWLKAGLDYSQLKWKKCFAFLQGLVSFVLGSLDLWYPSKCSFFSTVSGLFSLRFTQHGDISTVRVYSILLTQHTDPAKSGYNIHLGDVVVWAVHFIQKHI